MEAKKNYSSVAKFLHWAMAVLIICELLLAYLFGSVSEGILENYQEMVYWLHFNIGYTIFMLLVLRIIWRLFNKPPALPKEMSATEAKFANLGHVALYGLMATMTITGILRYNLHSGSFKYLNLIDLPSLVNFQSRGVGYTIIATIHNLCGSVLVATVAVHAAMAIRHHLIDKNDILTRMLPSCAKKSKK